MPDIADVRRNLYQSLALIAILYLIGTIVYHNVEGWSFLDSVYFITITLATVGYGDFHPTTTIGKMFTIFFVLIGVSIALSLIYSIAAYRERTFDRQVMSRLSIFKNLTSMRGNSYMDKRKPPFMESIKSKIGEI